MRTVATWRMAVGIAIATVVIAVSAPPTIGAEQACRVRNVTQDTVGDTLKQMVKQADDGDRLWVRGRCPGEIVIDADIVIAGTGDQPTLTGRDRGRVVSVKKGADAILRDLAVRQGRKYWGGGILNEGRLALRAVLVASNTARHVARFTPSTGGGIVNEGTMRLIRTTVRRNDAEGTAGGIYNDGRMVLRDSLVSHNWTRVYQRDPYGGGGIYNWGRLRLVDSRVVDNEATDNGGGIYGSSGRLMIVRSRIARNSASIGGGIATNQWATLIDSTVTGNDAEVGGGISNNGNLMLVGSTVMRNTGDGIWNQGRLQLDEASSVRRNTPDDCPRTRVC